MDAMIDLFLQYKAWANRKIFDSVLALPEGEAVKQRKTLFGSMVHTLNHVYVVDDIFRHHLNGEPHGYNARNTEETPPLAKLWDRQQEMDEWYLAYGRALSESERQEVVAFDFVDGGNGAMTRDEILLHIVNHGTYHRGFVSDMMYQVPAKAQANDFTVFLRDRGKTAD